MANIDLYSPKVVRKIRDEAKPKRDFLTSLFFGKKETVPTEEILLEISKSGEHIAPLVTPLESGRPVIDKTISTNLVVAPNVGVEYVLTPKDYFLRDPGETLLNSNYSPAKAVGKRIGEILQQQETYIANREELMVSQFLTTGKVQAIADDVGYEVDYGMTNKSTLQHGKKWGETGINPLASLDEVLEKAEETGIMVDTVVMGSLAAQKLMESKEFKKEMLSKDLQSEFVKTVLRQYPGVVWLGTYKTYGVELFRYSRKLIGNDKKAIDLMPKNMIVGGPTKGKILYSPIVNMGKGDIHLTSRYSNVTSPTEKTKKITTEARPVLQPCDMDAYFSVVVCDAE
ncbi:hypothetical protein IX317_001849 [Fusobacterium sp. DD29]|uniref:major capsid protein n=1 Tax=unclassified Fusobacterium TaxID=2648384 RepID=UPI001B8AB606|nr:MULTISPECIES: major capsid protein [unclassified Fusobacterium]MBR8701153.1 hypothetical protein [Fusobacterium sp. DD45]MBR8711334.1 hypothetical protein [Fusobacterium sp. DD28]MBR8750165.1 hypothetical protein [Fusobacterium sp. DD29]MBR8751883.1 hypothetical protein [Fusobacterium sp. DD26]MBR8762407.1 hypothetical protein [Fusobacterium sp. DD25]